MLLELHAVSKHFPSRAGAGEVRAVDEVTFGIERGQFVTLLGPSGCGKTTTLRLIAGFEFPTHGHILLDGALIDDLPPNRRDMAMVFQSYAIFPHLNVFENIAYGLKIKRLSSQEIKRKVGAVLDLTELQGLENRSPNQLSGGQQQRVALARALVMEPKVLLFDEPLSNLDAKLRVQMRSEIRRIQQELGITSVYVTHDQDEAMVLSDQIVIMHQGRLQQVGAAVEIYRRPQSRFVADFIGRANFLPVQVVEKGVDHWRVALMGVPLLAPAAKENAASVGGEALLLARPESIRLAARSPQEQLALWGVVRRASYLGSQVEYDVSVGDTLITSILYDPGEQDLFPPGTEVALNFLERNLYLLPAEA